MIPQEDSTIKSEDIQKDNNEDNIVFGSKHQLSLTWGGLSVGSIAGGIVSILKHNGKGRMEWIIFNI